MTRDDNAAAPSDAELVAYLDGELSPAESVRIGQRLTTDEQLAARVEHLMAGGRPFRQAFEPLLAQAPVDKLDAMLDAALARPNPRVRLRPLLVRVRPALAAAAAALMIAGVGLDRLVIAPIGAALTASGGNPDGSDDWRSAVAQYLALYTRDTLADMRDGPGDSRQQLASLGERLGLSLTPTRVDLPALPLKRADLYDYDDKPLAFLAYLDPRSGPVALCITTGGGSDVRRVERRGDMNIVYWSQGRHRFMLIGRASSGTLQALATTVASRFAENG